VRIRGHATNFYFTGASLEKGYRHVCARTSLRLCQSPFSCVPPCRHFDHAPGVARQREAISIFTPCHQTRLPMPPAGRRACARNDEGAADSEVQFSCSYGKADPSHTLRMTANRSSPSAAYLALRLGTPRRISDTSLALPSAQAGSRRGESPPM